MGTPIEEPEYGVDCAHCVPLRWAADKTPKYLLAMVTGIELCPGAPPGHPAPPNGAWILTQLIGFPCIWRNITAPYHLRYNAYANSCQFRIWDINGFLAFDDINPEPCEEHFTNSVACGPGTDYADGSVFVDLAGLPGTAYQLMYEYSLNPVGYSKFDVLEVPEEPPYVQVRRCANIRTPMNIKIKTDSTHKDQYETFEK